jgi:MarR family transcriptional regulator, negative regulator of the multidrug operon emrRAB
MHAQSPRTANLVGAWSLVVADAVTRTTERETGLGGAVPAALVTIGAVPGQSIEELRAALGLSQPGAVRLVDRLAGEGWVERRAGRRARTVALALTPRGRRMLRRVLAARERAVAELLAPLEPADANALAGALERLLHARGQAGRDPDRVCRLCERAVCERCPVAEGSRAAAGPDPTAEADPAGEPRPDTDEPRGRRAPRGSGSARRGRPG